MFMAVQIAQGGTKMSVFFNVPSVISHQGEKTKELSVRRRNLWLANINRDAVTKGEIKTPEVCSRHFHEGNIW